MTTLFTRAARVGLIAGLVFSGSAIWMLSAQAAGTNAGNAIAADPANGQPLASGTKDTDFTLKLPTGAACTGDSANDAYRVQSYHVKSSVDPSTLTFDGSGPMPNAAGANFSQPLYAINGSPYVDAQTAPASPAPGPGPVTNIPAFDLSLYDATTLPAGTYNLGIACTKGNASPTQQDKFWNVVFTIAANGSWTAANSTGGGSSSTTSTTAPSSGSTTSTTAPGATTSTTAAGGATTTSTSTTSTTRPTTVTTISTTPTSGNAAVNSMSLARTGDDTPRLLLGAFLLCAFGRLAFVLSRPMRIKGSHLQ